MAGAMPVVGKRSGIKFTIAEVFFVERPFDAKGMFVAELRRVFHYT